MKYLLRLLFIAGAGLIWTARAQTPDDIRIYNSEGLYGTARYIATGGSMMSLGADLSAVADNPAGAVYFITNRLSYSPGFYNRFTEGIYNGTKHFSSDYSLDHHILFSNQLGLVLPYFSDTEDWNKIAFGFNYQVDENYYNRFRAEGQSPDMQSLADYFVYHAQGVPLGDLTVYEDESDEMVYEWLGEHYGAYAQHAFLGYQAYVIDPVSNDPDNFEYVSNASYSRPLHHNIRGTTGGKKSSADFFFAAEYQKKWAVGISLHATDLQFSQKRHIEEWDYDPQSTLQYVKYTTGLNTKADGLGLKIGTTYKLNDNVKLSLAYHSPVWWKISEETTEGIHTQVKDTYDTDGDGDTDETFEVQIYPTTVNAFEPYRMVSPAKWLVGASWVDKKHGFISVKYSIRPWQSVRVSALSDDPASQDYFEALTEDIRQHFGTEHTLAVGGEFKVDKLMLRAGYSTTKSPLKNIQLPARNRINFGLGYDFGAIDVDFGIVNGRAQDKYQILPVGLTHDYQLNTRTNQYVFTIKANF